ncbi:MAG: hypothetical protein JWM35_1874 [Verrucomicrobia bacterium]|nr:hypothetical protein [Verrucomicrobiota bacterium]
MKLTSSRLIPVCLLPLSLAFFAGCESGPDRHTMEETRKSVPSLAANETFFDGRISTRLTLGSSLAEKQESGKDSGGKSGPGARGGGGRGRHGGGHRGGGGEDMGGGAREGGGNYDANSSEELRARYVDSPMPPAVMRLQLMNTSGETMKVEIRDLNSELGNFATRPDTFTLEAGGTGEPGEMQSLLGVDSLALPVTLTLRVDGKSETKVLTLRPTAPPADAKPATP